MQEYTSKNSSIKQIPFGFKIVDKYFGWKPNSINLDIGGGKYDLFTNKLKEKRVTNLIYDPFNRTKDFNENSLNYATKFGVDTVTIFNVLNVIKEYDIQISIIKLGFDVLKNNGMIFIRSTYKNPKGYSTETNQMSSTL